MRPSASAGAARMRALAADLPNGLADGYRAGRELELPNGTDVVRLYAVGMGGSAIAADLARCVVDAESPLALSVLRTADLPSAVDRRARVVLISYSGETGETISAYAAAGRAGTDRVVVTSGGTLAERAEAEGVPVLRVPPGLPARAAVGHLVGGILGLLDPVFPESNEARIGRVADRVRAAIGRFVRPDSEAGRIAAAIGRRFPWVYAEHGFLPLARRWAGQIEENAKRLAAYDEAPELFHNAVAGWSALRRSEAARHVVLRLEWSQERADVRAGFRSLARLLAGRGVPTVPVPLPADDRLEAVMVGVALGDQVSLRLAEAAGVDPCPVDAIDRMRDLPPAEPDRPAAVRTSRGTVRRPARGRPTPR